MKDVFLSSLRDKAKKDIKRIVYPEGTDERILEAVVQVKKEGLAEPIVLGPTEKIRAIAQERGFDLAGIRCIDPLTSDEAHRYAQELHALRKAKGVSEHDALRMVRDPSYYGTMMVQSGDADGLISGATHTTADTLRPALQIIKTKPGIKIASSFFIMLIGEKVYLFADCGFVIDPDAEQLSEIALSTAESARRFGIEPKVAMLSFSTKGSAHDPVLQKVVDATRIVRRKDPGLVVDGEIQLDAAIIPEVAARKCPESPLEGEANVLIFPDLNSGNIGYKLTERLAHAMALGPVVQGLRKPINDLSRGCAVHDIVEMTAITAVEAQR